MAKKILWRAKLGKQVAGPVVAGELVIAGTAAKSVHAVDATTGKSRWKVSVGGEIRARTVCDAKTAYVGSMDRMVYAIDLATGKLRWSTATPSAIYYAAAIAGDLVLVPSSNGALAALDASTGDVRWTAKTGADFPSTPTVDGELAYVSAGKSIHAFALKNGRRAAKVGVATKLIRTAPVVTDTRIFVGSGEAGGKGAVWSFDKATHKQRWKHALPHWCAGALAVEGNALVAGGEQPLVGLDATTGKVKWSFKDGPDNHDLAIEDGTVVFCHGKALVAVKSGKKSWSCALGFDPGPLTAGDGVVYVGDRRGVTLVAVG